MLINICKGEHLCLIWNWWPSLTIQMTGKNWWCSRLTRKGFNLFSIELKTNHVWTTSSLQNKIQFVIGTVWVIWYIDIFSNLMLQETAGAWFKWSVTWKYIFNHEQFPNMCMLVPTLISFSLLMCPLKIWRTKISNFTRHSKFPPSLMWHIST
jgi:hypothetical protein